MSEREEKQDAREIAVKKGKFLSWLDNYWYHYKWHTVVVAFVLTVCLFCFGQCVRRETGDVTVAYVGGYSMNTTQRNSFIQSLSILVPKAETEDETVTVLLSDYVVFSDEELRVMFTDPETGDFAVSAYESMRQQCVQNMRNFGDYVMTGECGLYFVRESVYKEQNLKTLAAPLSDYCDIMPECAYDEYAIRLSDTAFYRYYEAIQFLPEDTLVVLTKPYIYGSTSDENVYSQFEQIFLAILAFQPPANSTAAQ